MQDPGDLLDIKQAAALLKVSETSLRRWTNAGLLKSYRIGGRRERRFRREDLLAFLAGTTESQTGHFCGFYSSEQGRVRQATSFLSGGLASRSTVFLAASPDVRTDLLEHLAESHPRLEADVKAHRLRPVDFAHAPGQQVSEWKRHFVAASTAGAHALHVFGDVSGARFERETDFKDVLEFEKQMDAVYHEPGTRRTALCLYDARQLSGQQVMEILRVHPDMMKTPASQLLA